MNRGRYIVIAVVAATAVVLSIVVFSMLNNDPPVITSLEADAEKVFPSGSTEFVCTAIDPDDDRLSYAWSTGTGTIEGEGTTITWTAPDYEGIFSVSVTVTDGRRGEATQDRTIEVRANEPPEIDSLTSEALWTTPSGSLQITCSASDPNGHELIYTWSATGGHIIGTGATASWTAPAELDIYEIAVVVTDGHGGTATETLHVSVVTGEPPVIESLLVEADHKYIRETASGYQVGEGKDFRIQCTASHPDDLELTYEWEWDDGEVSEISEDASVITWTAPFTRGELVIIVIVSDFAGNMVSQNVALEVVSCSRFG